MKITAAVVPARSARFEIETLDLVAPLADEVLVRVVATGMCHTDLHARDGYFPNLPYPVVCGHEGAGIIEQVGAAVADLATDRNDRPTWFLLTVRYRGSRPCNENAVVPVASAPFPARRLSYAGGGFPRPSQALCARQHARSFGWVSDAIRRVNTSRKFSSSAPAAREIARQFSISLRPLFPRFAAACARS
jgi:hypothetical protein